MCVLASASKSTLKMADGGVDIDLYSDDIDQGFGPIKVRILVKFSKIFPIFNNLAITSETLTENVIDFSSTHIFCRTNTLVKTICMMML